MELSARNAKADLLREVRREVRRAPAGNMEVRTADGRVIGRGLSAYAAADVQAIKGQQSDDIENILGFRGRSEVIHRDDLAIGI